jgi:type IV pilus assembly protein PilV
MLKRKQSSTLYPRSKYVLGFTLIEVLVTIVVVSIGLLGLAGLQINGLRANVSSEARSKATLLANDIIERMRANP